MSEQLIYEVFLALLLVLSTGLGIFFLRQPSPRKQDLLMGWGAITAASGGLVFTLAISEIVEIPNELVGPSFGLVGLGMLAFSVGYLVDQLLSLRIRKLGVNAKPSFQERSC